MSIGFLDLIFSVLVAFLGVLTGWFWRRSSPPSRSAESASGSKFEEVESVLARLHDLAAGVAADVGEHSTQVEAINSQLTAEAGGDAAVVVSAVSQLLEANSRMQQQLDTAQEQLRQQAEEIESQTAAARTDVLTNLANRRVFDDEIARLTRQFREKSTPFAVTILDIDHFKKFNDTHGHQMGDRVLQHAAQVYLASVPETDIVTRFGGEEFAVIHPATSVDEAVCRAETLRKALDASKVSGEGKELRVTASLGVAEFVSDETPGRLIQRADAALYAAKEAGRNRTYWHNGESPHPFVAAPEKPRTTPAAKAAPAESPTSASLAAPQPKNLMDRQRFLAKLTRSIAEAGDGQSVPTAFLVRADRFEDHVDRFGGDAGERILDAIATVLLAVARTHGTVARFDAQTFAVLFSGYDPVQAMQMAEQIRKFSKRCPLPTASGTIQFSLSIGAARAAENDDVTRMVGRAETALDSALRSSGDCSFFHNGQWTETAEAVLHEANCSR